MAVVKQKLTAKWYLVHDGTDILTQSDSAYTGELSFNDATHTCEEYATEALIDTRVLDFPLVSTTLNDGLVAHWKFNDNALDSVGSHDMTLFNTPLYVAGINDKAIEFNSPKYGSVASHADFDREALDFSWIFEYKPKNLTGNHYLLARWGTSLVRQFYVYTSGTSLKAAIQTQAQVNKTITSSATLAVDSRYMIELSKEGTVLSLRVNDAAKVDLEMSAQMRSVVQNIIFGSLNPTAGYADGEYCFAEFYNRVLSESEITEKYNGGAIKGYPYV